MNPSGGVTASSAGFTDTVTPIAALGATSAKSPVLTALENTLNLADVYAVVSRYLAAPEPFEEYLRIREDVAGEARRKIEAFQGLQGNLREILLARAKGQEEARAQAGQ